MTDSTPASVPTGKQADPPALAAPIPMADIDDPLTVAIFHAFESYDDDAVQDQDGDYTRGLARLAAHVVKETLLNNRGALFDLTMSNLPPDVPARFEGDESTEPDPTATYM